MSEMKEVLNFNNLLDKELKIYYRMLTVLHRPARESRDRVHG